MASLVASIERTAFNPVEVIFYIDNDDLPSIERASELDCQAVVGPRITMSDTYNRCAEVARGDILMECCDAVVFGTRGWDQLVEAEFAKFPDKILLVFADDKIHHGAQAALPFLHRRWLEVTGRFTPPYFSADWCDTWLNEVANEIGRIRYLAHVLIEHRHPIAGTAPIDQTYLERLERGVKDDVAGRYASLEMALEREADARKLREVMA